MDEIIIGAVAPDFNLPATGEIYFSLNANRGKKIILFFYSKDNTAGCTNQVREFGRTLSEILAAGVLVFGISRDSLQAHEKFSAKLELPYPLLSDTTGSVCKLYDVLKEKNMYGKKVIGVERSTFIIDSAGRIAKVFFVRSKQPDMLVQCWKDWISDILGSRLTNNFTNISIEMELAWAGFRITAVSAPVPVPPMAIMSFP